MIYRISKYDDNRSGQIIKKGNQHQKIKEVKFPVNNKCEFRRCGFLCIQEKSTPSLTMQKNNNKPLYLEHDYACTQKREIKINL